MSLEQLAREAAISNSSALAVGEFLEVVDEAEPGVVTYYFNSKLKGYVGWRWAVSLFQENAEITVSEVNLVAGEDSVLAPKWVPWSERLADYKALQAALEQQAAEEAAAAAEDAKLAETAGDAEEEPSEDSEDEDDFAEVEEIGVDDLDENSASSASDDDAEQAESDAEEAGANPPSFFRIFRRGKKRK